MSEEKSFFLKPSSVEKIKNWITENNFTLENGFFNLVYKFDFAKFYDDNDMAIDELGVTNVNLDYVDKNTGKSHSLTVENLSDSKGSIKDNTVDSIDIDAIKVLLKFSMQDLDEIMNMLCINLAEQMEEQKDINCWITFTIYPDKYTIHVLDDYIKTFPTSS